ncbi:YybH family protein [Chitinophaga sancti]|uniref:DUF4440 domain-containing protein n=1 Tax=Chitinophaga sancti TaxID=1004 RepID=A0A1K1SYT0_9BACT|nr:DUF4440 domain-containing protein [Chitinophaga sancti]WQD60508.1 DUF4440 domain-containing protein [Chitinophaga sancti]WQG87365.1 DUF4440 domain-containing protein [Chitinophaga sancti]SFW89223.1 protein of unknown function [Chitinophaga sancti]
MRFILYLILLTAPSIAVLAQAPDSDIRQLLRVQTDTWNQGNIEGFMQTYWQSDSLVFVGSHGPTYGWKATLERYKKSYPDTAAMGKLDFNILEIRTLEKNLCFVVGKWHLKRSVGDLQGAYTLLIKRIKGQWKIIADHSS